MVRHPGICFDLPPPDAQAAAHSARIAHYIRHKMDRNGGSISFARFMEWVLYAPGLGYYNAGVRKFGAAGDFVTAPELSSLFSRCVARQCQEILEDLKGAHILELGAGSGMMAADMLLELKALNSLPNHYQILEVSATLRRLQQETLAARVPDLLERVQWLEALPDPGFRGVILGNEILDAMPVERFRITGEGPLPMHVAWQEGGFIWREGEPSRALKAFIDAVQEELGFVLPLGYESEYSPLLKPWLRTLAELLEAGALLLIDYGYPRREYYHPERVTGTLLCHYRHRAHANPLILPGLQDITASVDFTAVADGASAAGLQVAGYTEQGYFLLSCGIGELLAEVNPEDALRYLELARQVKLLTLPGEMGGRFKAIAFTRELDIPLRGFTLFDQRGRL
jgi:SAM-dependent MidA family methyltransferase